MGTSDCGRHVPSLASQHRSREKGEAGVIELPDHPFVGTLLVPQSLSTPLNHIHWLVHSCIPSQVLAEAGEF
jgi:hypothetical protein